MQHTAQRADRPCKRQYNVQQHDAYTVYNHQALPIQSNHAMQNAARVISHAHNHAMENTTCVMGVWVDRYEMMQELLATESIDQLQKVDIIDESNCSPVASPQQR